ncbi:helix-turn-helix transcriptional regulator [Streptomyces sp. NPDC055109]
MASLVEDHLNLDWVYDPSEDAIIACATVIALAESGNIKQARSVAESFFRLSVEKWGLNSQRSLIAQLLGRISLAAGDASIARRWFSEAECEATKNTALEVMALSGYAAAAALEGDIIAAEATLRKRKKISWSSFLAEKPQAEAWLCAARGEMTLARSILKRAADDARTNGLLSIEFSILVDIARLGDARGVIRRVSSISESLQEEVYTIRAKFVHGLVCGDAESLIHTATLLKSCGHSLIAAEAATVAAAHFRLSRNVRRAETAAVFALEAMEGNPRVFTPLLIRTEGVPLTSREREVSLLAARGSTSQEISAALRLSVRTVQNHLQRAYAKAGVGNRRELIRMIKKSPARALGVGTNQG